MATLFATCTIILLSLSYCNGMTDFIVLPSDESNINIQANITISILPGAGNISNHPAPPNVNGYLSLIGNASPFFRAFGPFGGHPCGKRVRTSITAAAHKCRLATNASPFDMSNGKCNCGFYFHNSTKFGSGGWKPSFSVTSDGKWVIGTLNDTVAKSLNISESLNGFGWLVRNGKNAIKVPDTYIAPRTAIGVTKEGKVAILEVDGCEQSRNCKWTIGKTEYEMAELLIQLGVYHAINLDGGGSSSFVVNGKVVNHPTDLDLWSIKKERAVTTISCIV